MRSESPAGLRLSAVRVRDERLSVAVTMLALMLKDTALLPVAQQQDVRTAWRALQAVQAWCKHHQ